MGSLDDIRAERMKKLALLRERGIDPYPARSKRTHTIAAVREAFDSLTEPVTVAGRIMSIRGHGALVFIDLYDGTGTMQGYLAEDTLGREALARFSDTADIGDFIELSGTCTRTKRGEESILATSWRMLAKTLRPLPEKWHGLKDTEERFRKRYLDLLFSEDARSLVVPRGAFWRAVRTFMEGKGFLEVETPALETTTGGADARPFQ